jgi:hydroxymethylglutaryl-CoA reductase
MEENSQIKGFYKMSIEERQEIIRAFSDLTSEDIAMLNNPDALTIEKAGHMVENVVGRLQIPMGIATNLIVNGKAYLVPMATEEPSVIAAASNASKFVRSKGGVSASNSGPYMIAQMQIIGIKNPYYAKTVLMEHKEEIIKFANEQDAVLVSFGGGAKDIEVRVLDSKIGTMVILHLIVNTKDAMGANAVNTMAEALAPMIETISGGMVYLKILSNLADKRIIRARAVATKEELGGEGVVDAIVLAGEFANIDPYRAATHNKGIMNGISAVVLATGNDTRAVEAGAHAYASKSGIYTSLTKWEKTAEGDLAGSIELPVAVGLVGGATATHPTAKLAVKILGVKSAVELAEVIASVGLIQNLAAIKALATEGIQRGHMSLHARNIAINAGAEGELIGKVAEKMIAMKKVRVDVAKQILEELTKQE